jgi:hypothetical protein
MVNYQRVLAELIKKSGLAPGIKMMVYEILGRLLLEK